MAALKRELFLEFVVLALSVGFWCAVVPVSVSRDLSPAEMIGDALPAKTTMAKARRPDLLTAVCAAVRKHPAAGPGLTSAAIAARGEFSAEIVGTVLRCAGKVDCDYVRAVVQAALSARPAAATAISDAAMGQTPKCEEAIEAAARLATTEQGRAKASASDRTEQSPSPAGPEEAFDPHEQLVLICDKGTSRLVRKSQVDDFLRAHAGAVPGSCPSTPSPTP